MKRFYIHHVLNFPPTIEAQKEMVKNGAGSNIRTARERSNQPASVTFSADDTTAENICKNLPSGMTVREMPWK
jgi:hypothetical protein